jgi:hypothetical protein
MITLTTAQKNALLSASLTEETVWKLYLNTKNRSNRIFDSGFEVAISDSASWDGTMVKNAVVTKFGMNSLCSPTDIEYPISFNAYQYLCKRNDDFGLFFLEKNVRRLEAGKRYVLSFYHKRTTHVGTVNVSIILDDYSGSDVLATVQIVSAAGPDGTTADWTRSHIAFTATHANLGAITPETTCLAIDGTCDTSDSKFYIACPMLHEDIQLDDLSWSEAPIPYIPLEPIQYTGVDDGVELQNVVEDYSINSESQFDSTDQITLPSGTLKIFNEDQLWSPTGYNASFDPENDLYIGPKQIDGYGAFRAGNRLIAFNRYHDTSGVAFTIPIGIFAIEKITPNISDGIITIEFSNYWSDLSRKVAIDIIGTTESNSDIIRAVVALSGYNMEQADSYVQTTGTFKTARTFLIDAEERAIDILAKISQANMKAMFANQQSQLVFRDIVSSYVDSGITLDEDDVVEASQDTGDTVSVVVVKSDPIVIKETEGKDVDNTKDSGNIDASKFASGSPYSYLLTDTNVINAVDITPSSGFDNLFNGTTKVSSHNPYTLADGDQDAAALEYNAPFIEIDIGQGAHAVSALHLWLDTRSNQNYYFKVTASLDRQKWWYLAGDAKRFSESNPDQFEDHKTVVSGFPTQYLRYIRLYMNGSDVSATNGIFDMQIFRDTFQSSFLGWDGSGFGTIELSSTGINVWKNETHCDANISFQILSRTGHTRIRGIGLSCEADPILHISGTGSSGFKIYDGGISAYNVAGDKTFHVDTENGNICVTGTLCSCVGNIGGWTLGANSLTAGTGTSSVGLVSCTTAGSVAFFAGCGTPTSAPFRVTNDGQLVATNAAITGEITANSGVIGGWIINSNFIARYAGSQETPTSTIVIGDTFASNGAGGIFWSTADANSFFYLGELPTFEVGGCDVSTAGFELLSHNLSTGHVFDVGFGTSLPHYNGCEWMRCDNSGFVLSLNGCEYFIVARPNGAGDPFARIAGWNFNSACLYSGNLTLNSSGAITGCYTAGCTGWCISSTGSAEFNNVTVRGTVCSSLGIIGGFTIGSSTLSAGTTTTTVGISSCNTCPAFWTGATLGGDGLFQVSHAGLVTATAGTIAGFTISSTEGIYGGTGATRVQMKPGAGFWTGHDTQTSAPFYVTQAGSLYSTCGNIAGWDISADGIFKDNGACSIGLVPSDYPFYAGCICACRSKAPFRVSRAGSVTAISGSIAGWCFDASCICSENIVLERTGSIRTIDFTNGLRGWCVSCSGSAEFNSVIVRGELRSSVFKYDELSVVGGQALIVSADNIVEGTTTGSDVGSSYKLCAGAYFCLNDIIRMKTLTNTGVVDAWGKITACASCCGTYEYCVIHCYGSCSAVIPKKTAVASYGPVTGGNGILLNGQGDHSAYIDVFSHDGDPWTHLIPNVRIGNISGMSVGGTPLSAGTHGLWTSNGYFVGGIVISSNWTTNAGTCINLSDGCIAIGGSSSPTFTVTPAGAMTATIGNIGGWDISSTNLSKTIYQSLGSQIITLDPIFGVCMSVGDGFAYFENSTFTNNCIDFFKYTITHAIQCSAHLINSIYFCCGESSNPTMPWIRTSIAYGMVCVACEWDNCSGLFYHHRMSEVGYAEICLCYDSLVNFIDHCSIKIGVGNNSWSCVDISGIYICDANVGNWSSLNSKQLIICSCLMSACFGCDSACVYFPINTTCPVCFNNPIVAPNVINIQSCACSFAGTSGVEITISDVGSTNYRVSITPTQNACGNLGEIWVTKTSGTKFTVYNSGTATTSFDWMVTQK